MTTKKMIFTSTEEMYKALREISSDTERDMSWHIRKGLAEYMERYYCTIDNVHPPKRGGYRKNSGRKAA